MTTDHGGPNHSLHNLQQTYPELVASRKAVPDLVQFYGMEFDTPGADHSSLIIPFTHNEKDMLFTIEHRFSKKDPSTKPVRNSPTHMLAALQHRDALPIKPVLIANHPSRTASGSVKYGLDEPWELRDWNDTAPSVAVGMAGAPGHQAAARKRGAYRAPLHPTMGGFDQMTAVVRGFWDSMLGEGRRWWITANSDSHKNWRDRGEDFLPGEYSKTFVWTEKNHDDILEGIRNGRIFVTTGDLISELYVTAQVAGVGAKASIGEALSLPSGATVIVTIRFLDPGTKNANGDDPSVARVDLITGDVSGTLAHPNRNADRNTSTRVKRFPKADWTASGSYRTITHLLKDVTKDGYLRVRGTNGSEPEPLKDPAGEDPWSDLWFYSNPIFLEIQ